MPQDQNFDNGQQEFNISLGSDGDLSFNANGRNGAGDTRMVIADGSGMITIGGTGGSGQLQLKSSTGGNSVFLDGGGTEAAALLGGAPGQSGRIQLFDGSARRTVDLDGRLGVLILGADGVDGDLSVLDSDAVQALVVNGDERTLQMFSAANTKRTELDGALGRLQLSNSAGVVTADLRGDSGVLVLGADGSDGDLTIKDDTGATTISCDGDTGHVECSTLTETSGARLAASVASVAPLHRALDRVLALRGVRYQLTHPVGAAVGAGAEEIGFVGQELEAVFPELTATDSAGHTGVRYSRMTVVLVEAIKEQQQLIRDQAAALATACQRIAALEAGLVRP